MTHKTNKDKQDNISHTFSISGPFLESSQKESKGIDTWNAIIGIIRKKREKGRKCTERVRRELKRSGRMEDSSIDWTR
jgi:hypothetical protein